MTLDEFRFEMVSYWHSVDDEAKSLKNPHIVLEKLRILYVKFDGAERLMADKVLSEWVLSEDEEMRFDALGLIDDLKIETAAPALHELTTRLTTSDAPNAPYELKKVLRIISILTA